jgi:phage-related protein
MLYFGYQIIFYVTRARRIPVIEYLDHFAEYERAEIEKSFIFLKKKEGRLPAPYSKHLFKKLWELRIKYLNHHHRILYFIDAKRKIVLLSGFLKKSKKTPRAEIVKAYKYYLDYLTHSL